MWKKIGLCLISIWLLGAVSGCQKPQEGSSGSSKETVTTKQTKDGKVYLYVARHGKTMFNSVHRVQGWSDTPLTKEGEEVAKKLGAGFAAENVRFQAAYTSDSGRARQTARLVLNAVNQSKLDFKESTNLREVGFGSYEGRLNEEMWGDFAKKIGYQDMDDVVKNFDKIGLKKAVDTFAAMDESKQAETFEQVQTRMQKELRTIAEKTAKKGGGNVLIVAHGMSILTMIDNLTEQAKPTQLANASVTELTYEKGKFTVGKIGDTHYLEAD